MGALCLCGRLQYRPSDCVDCTDDSRRVFAESSEFVFNWIHQKLEFKDFPGMNVSWINCCDGCVATERTLCLLCGIHARRVGKASVCVQVRFEGHGTMSNFVMLA